MSLDLLASAENQEVIHIVRLDEVMLLYQREAGTFGFFDDQVAVEAVIVALAVAVNDAEQCTGAQSLAGALQQTNRLGDLMVSL